MSESILIDFETGEILEPEVVTIAEPTTAQPRRVFQKPQRSRTNAQADALVQAHVILMENEVITRNRNPDWFRLINNQFAALQSWHDVHTGWRIRRTPAVIRLVRTPSAFIPGYVFRTLYKPRDFACFVWTLWYAESRVMSGRGNEQQFLMSQLAEQLQEQTNIGRLAPHVAALDFRKQDDRYSLSRALKALQDLGGLQLVDGGTEDWVLQQGENDALWEFTEVTRSLMLSLDLQKVLAAGELLDGDPYTIRPTLLPDQDSSDTLQRAWRTLLLGPALFHYDDPAAFVALQQNVEQVRRNLAETFGWELDLRYEYAQVIRASGTTQGPVTLLNLTGAADQAALLVCDVIRQKIANGEWRPQPIGSERDGCLLVSAGDVSEVFRQVRERYEPRWGNTARKEGFHRLLNSVYEKLRQAGLMRGPDRNGNVLLLPTVARYSVSYSRQDEEAAQEQAEVATEPEAVQTQLDLGEVALLPTEKIKAEIKLPAAKDGYSAAEAGKILGVTGWTVMRWITAGRVKAEKRGNNWFIPTEQIERLKQERNV